MAKKSLTDLTSRTATAATDLMHINSGGTDYKQTKDNFLKGDFAYTFDNTTAITTQADALGSSGQYVGKINSYGHQAETGMPMNNSFYVTISIYSANYKKIEATDVDVKATYVKYKISGTWESSWTKMPTRNEADKVSEALSMQGPGSATFSISNSTRALVVLGGSAAARWGMWFVYCGSTGTMYIVPVGTPGANVTLTSSANNRFTVATTASNAIAIDIVRFTSGTIEEV